MKPQLESHSGKEVLSCSLPPQDEDGNGEIEYKEFMDLVNAPQLDVAGVARIEWLQAKAKAEKEEQKLKQKAYQVRCLVVS